MAAPIQGKGPIIRFRGIDELPQTTQKTNDSSFADLFKRALNDASDLQADAKGMIEAFVRGEPVELHDVMASIEEAGITLELLVEIRNKLTEAYRTVQNMA